MSYVRTRLGRWYFEEWGRSRRAGDPTFVLCHGLFFDGGCWRAQAEALSSLGRVIVLDGPGHGFSEVPPPFTLEDHADALIDVHEALKFERSVVCGISWGAMIGMRLALRHKFRVAGLALLDTNAGGQTFVERTKYRALLQFATHVGLPRVLAESQIVPEMFGATTLRERPELADSFLHRLAGYKREGVAIAARAVLIERRSIVAELPKIDCPTVVVVGEEDVATPKAFADTIGTGLGAPVVVIPRAGHTAALESPAAVSEVLVKFAERVLGSARP